MSCKPADKKPEKEPVGFFASLFGGGSSSAAEPESTKCPGGCGQERCNCNCALKAHLKECCGLGKLPELTVCSKIQQQKKDAPPAPTVDNTCDFPPVNLDCNTNVRNPKGGLACSAKDADKKCPPLPDTDTLACIPIWLCPEPSKRKTYPAPKGEVILPISAGARNTSRKADAKCNECGTITKTEVPETKVMNKSCPALRPETPCAPKKEDEPKECSIMSKIRSIFGGGGEKASEFQSVCEKLNIEDEQIRHHRDVFNPTLLIRRDGYMHPIFRVDCAGKSPPEKENCDCDECISERANCLAVAARQSIHSCFQSQLSEPCGFITPDKTYGDFVCPTETDITPLCFGVYPWDDGSESPSSSECTTDDNCNQCPMEELSANDCPQEEVVYDCPQETNICDEEYSCEYPPEEIVNECPQEEINSDDCCYCPPCEIVDECSSEVVIDECPQQTNAEDCCCDCPPEEIVNECPQEDVSAKDCCCACPPEEIVNECPQQTNAEDCCCECPPEEIVNECSQEEVIAPDCCCECPLEEIVNECPQQTNAEDCCSECPPEIVNECSQVEVSAEDCCCECPPEEIVNECPQQSNAKDCCCGCPPDC